MDLHNIEKDIETTRNHLSGINIINEAKTLFEEYVSNEKQMFQDYIITGQFIKEVVQTIFPNKLVYEWASSSFVNNEEQLLWIIKKLEEIKRKAEKTKYFYSNRQTKSKYQHKRESKPEKMKNTLSSIEKRENYKRRKKEMEQKIQIKRQKNTYRKRWKKKIK